MPWTNQGGGNGGGWKGGGGGGSGGGGGPWGQGGGNNQQPDLEEMLKRSQDRVRRAMDGGGFPGPLMLLVAAIGCAFIAWHAFFFRVDADQIGVVLRFGEFSRQEGPGLHYRLPPPIDDVRVVKVTDQKTMDIGTRVAGGSRDSSSATMMLTGDENIVDLRFTVYWRIRLDKVQDYIFNIANPENTVREVGESVMREVVGQTPLLSLLTLARDDVQKTVQKRMQDILDGYGAGVKIDQVQLREVDPPQEVIAAFREVQAAAQDRETRIKEAQKHADQVVPVAKGEADRIRADAQGYRDQTVAEAQGQAARFLKVYEEYKKSPDVTRQRLFLESTERVLGGANKIVIDGKSGQGVVPYLPLGELTAGSPKRQGAN